MTNWWKVGCIVALLAFEVTREYAVISAYEPVHGAAILTLEHNQGYTIAEGTWKEIDGKPQAEFPESVRIDCEEEKKQCVAASIRPNDSKYVAVPWVRIYDATFNGSTISYDDDYAMCDTQHVTIDLAKKTVIERSDLRPVPQGKVDCSGIAPHYFAALADSKDFFRSPMEGHFVPVLGLMAWVTHPFG